MKAKQRAAGCNPARNCFSPDADAGASHSCRICFEEGCDPHELISPCLCKGTQKYVHVKCLRRWQVSVQRHMHRKDKLDDRAYRCGVCREMYSLPPCLVWPGGRIWGTLRALAATSAIAVLALGLSGGPPWPHLAIALLVLLGARSSSLLCVLGLVLACTLATLHTRGLRVVMRVDAMGRLGMAVIRHGAPVEGMHAGVLLAASEGLERSIFRRSVVLLYEHSARSGARGVILSQPLGPADPRLAPPAARQARQGHGALPHGAPSLSHFLGGPVGMPGDGPGQEVAVIHTLAEVPGARPLLVHNRTRGGGPPAGDQLFEGGSLADVAAAAAAAAAAASPQQPPPPAAGNAAGGWAHRAGRAGERPPQPPPPQRAHRPSVHVYHGVCAWSEGQLEGELRSGAWGFTKARLDDVLSVPPEQLWLRLTTQPGRLTWLRR